MGKCSVCKKETKLATIMLAGDKTYQIWLKRMCGECRSNGLAGLFKGLGKTDKSFLETAKMFEVKEEENK